MSCSFTEDLIQRIAADSLEDALAKLRIMEIYSWSPDETVEGALAKLREMYPGKQIAIDRTGGDGYIFKERIELRRERWSIRMDVFVSLGSGKTLAEALASALAAKDP